jgi:hypothetical protein
MDTLVKLLRELEARQFFGIVGAKFERGRVTVIRKTETYVPNGREKREENGCKQERQAGSRAQSIPL